MVIGSLASVSIVVVSVHPIYSTAPLTSCAESRVRRADALQEAFGDRTSGGVLRVTVWRTQDGVPVRGGVQTIDVSVDMRPVVTVIERVESAADVSA